MTVLEAQEVLKQPKFGDQQCIDALRTLRQQEEKELLIAALKERGVTHDHCETCIGTGHCQDCDGVGSWELSELDLSQIRDIARERGVQI